jgi:dipeptidyl aminopeptidase/acylaminoacyl peptidase
VASFSVAASGAAPLGYQWQNSGVAIPGATGASYSFKTAWVNDGRSYAVVVTDAAGKTITSAAAPLTVALPAELAGLKGRLAFVRNDVNKDAASDATTGTLYLFDFATRALSAISLVWPNVFYPKNPAFSPDGTRLVFAAYVDAAASEEDIFIWTVGSTSPPTNLTPGSGKRNEDPRFSPDGTRIVFKQKGDIVLLKLTAPGTVIPLTSHSGSVPEASQPYFMPDGVRVVFSVMTAAGSPASQVIQTLNVDATGGATGQRQVADASGLQAFYPVAWGVDQFLYTRWRGTADLSDVIYSYSLGTASGAALRFNRSGCDNADPFPADALGNLVFYVNNCPGGAGGFDLAIGSAVTGNSYPLTILDPAFATSNNELGPAYYPGP